MNRLKSTSIKFLKQGLSPSRIASAASMGLAVGIFPILGPFSLLCIGIAMMFRLNVPVALAGYYAMTFVQPLLIIPFLKIGEFIFQVEPMPISLTELTRRFADDALGTLGEFGWSFLHAIAGWLVMLPILFVSLYAVNLAIVNRWNKAYSSTSKAGYAAMLLALLTIPISVQADDADGERFPKTQIINQTEFRLSGSGILRYARIIKVYDIAYYTSPEGAKRLEVKYRVGADADRFNAAGDSILARSYPPERLAPIQERLETFKRLFPDPEKGDHCAITYWPATGTELTFNGKSLGVVQGHDFAEIYFSIWLGEDPASVALRDQLLAGAKSKQDEST